MRPNQIAFDFIEFGGSDRSPEATLARLAEYGKNLGLDHAILTGLPPPNDRLEKYVLAHSWPEEWFDRFTLRNYFHICAAGQWALRACQPFTYDEIPERFRLTPKAKRIRAEAMVCGVADCFIVPIRSGFPQRSALSFLSTSRIEIGPHERAALHFVALHSEGIIRKALGAERTQPSLSGREREVLAWAAEGKSAWEISVILSVSERTVSKHLEHVRAKLNAATTTQAVVEALRIGEIVL